MTDPSPTRTLRLARKVSEAFAVLNLGSAGGACQGGGDVVGPDPSLDEVTLGARMSGFLNSTQLAVGPMESDAHMCYDIPAPSGAELAEASDDCDGVSYATTGSPDYMRSGGVGTSPNYTPYACQEWSAMSWGSDSSVFNGSGGY